MAKKTVIERMKEKHDEYMEKMKEAKGTGLFQKAIRAKRKHKKELEEGVSSVLLREQARTKEIKKPKKELEEGVLGIKRGR